MHCKGINSSTCHASEFTRKLLIVRCNLESLNVSGVTISSMSQNPPLLQARLCHPAPQLAPAVLSRIENHYHELSTTNLCGLVWAGAVLEELQPSVFEAANTLLSARPLQEFTARVSDSRASCPESSKPCFSSYPDEIHRLRQNK